MSAPMRNIIIALAAITVVVGVFVVRFLSSSGQFTTLIPRVLETCEAVPAPAGPEDLVIDRENGHVFLSAYDRRAAWGGENVRGGIHRFSLKGATYSIVDVTPSTPEKFLPHGISLYTADDGQKTLYVINHVSPEQHQVERFAIDEKGDLRHLETIQDPAISSPNDIHAIGARQFYVTNDHANLSGTRRMMEDLFRWDDATLAFFDGNKGSIVAEGLTLPNGVNGSADGKSIYVTESTDRMLRLYDRNLENGTLKERDRVFLGTGVDNIDVAADGSLWIGAHPKMLTFASHRNNPDVVAPSQVIRVEQKPGGGGEAREIYLDLGEQISASSVAAVHEGKMVIGAVLDPKIVICTLDEETAG